jgi:hypothetical protein
MGHKQIRFSKILSGGLAMITGAGFFTYWIIKGGMFILKSVGG